MPLLALNLFARIVAMRVNARPPYMGTSMSRAKSAGKHHLSFGRYWRCDERKAWYILAALRTLRQTPPAVPPVADGRSVSLISACGDGEPDAYSTRRYVGRGPDKQDQPRGDETITNSLSCALLETTAPFGDGLPERLVQRT